MTDDLRHLEEALQADPNIAEALAEHNAACEVDEEDCVICNIKKSLAQLMFIDRALDHTEECEDSECPCEEVTSLDLAYSMIDSLESALFIVSACQTGIQLLAKIAQSAAFIIHHEEFDHEEDEDDDN